MNLLLPFRPIFCLPCSGVSHAAPSSLARGSLSLPPRVILSGSPFGERVGLSLHRGRSCVALGWTVSFSGAQMMEATGTAGASQLRTENHVISHDHRGSNFTRKHVQM